MAPLKKNGNEVYQSGMKIGSNYRNLASTAGERLEQRESEEKEALERVRALRMNDLKAQVEAAGLDWEYVVEMMAK